MLPGEDAPPKVAVGRGLLEDGRLQLEVLDDAAGPQVEVLAHDLGQLGGGELLGRPVVHDGDGERLCDSDGVRHLECTFAMYSCFRFIPTVFFRVVSKTSGPNCESTLILTLADMCVKFHKIMSSGSENGTHLHKASPAKAGLDEALGHPPRGVGS